MFVCSNKAVSWPWKKLQNHEKSTEHTYMQKNTFPLRKSVNHLEASLKFWLHCATQIDHRHKKYWLGATIEKESRQSAEPFNEHNGLLYPFPAHGKVIQKWMVASTVCYHVNTAHHWSKLFRCCLATFTFPCAAKRQNSPLLKFNGQKGGGTWKNVKQAAIMAGKKDIILMILFCQFFMRRQEAKINNP